jgi:threonine dehydratase
MARSPVRPSKSRAVAAEEFKVLKAAASPNPAAAASAAAAPHFPSSEFAPITLDELETAAALVHSVMPPTPLLAWPKLARRAGCKVYVKHENHTPAGAFKVRGGIVYMDRLKREQPKVPGVISATRGNHGQSIAFAASRNGIPATIYVPNGNSPDQNSAIAAFGATVVEFGKDFDEAKHEASRVATEKGLHLIPSFHRNLVMGVGTYALEIFRAVSDLDAVYVGVGMGSGICGLISARDAIGLETEIIGCGPFNAPATALSFAAGKPTLSASANTFADGLATREPNGQAIDIICRGVSRFVQVTEDEIAAAVRFYFDDTHHVAEGAGAAPLAALLKDRERMQNKKVGLVLSGGNIERARYLKILLGETPQTP